MPKKHKKTERKSKKKSKDNLEKRITAIENIIRLYFKDVVNKTLIKSRKGGIGPINPRILPSVSSILSVLQGNTSIRFGKIEVPNINDMLAIQSRLYPSTALPSRDDLITDRPGDTDGPGDTFEPDDTEIPPHDYSRPALPFAETEKDRLLAGYTETRDAFNKPVLSSSKSSSD